MPLFQRLNLWFWTRTRILLFGIIIFIDEITDKILTKMESKK